MSSARRATKKARGTSEQTSSIECAKQFEQIALVLQGGGALGAYQCGVYEALHDAGLRPDWFAGT
ncbi:MAG: patatin-like phospholipase family protein, partial [Dokdonella sp.]